MSVRPATAFVLLVWAGMVVGLHVYIGSWAERFPTSDETSLWALLRPLGEFSWRRVFTPHNEHFIPLPKLIHFALYRATADLRPAMFLQAELLGAVSLAMIGLVRRVRGRIVWTDAVFPLLFLHTGDAANLLNGFQLALTLPVALACGILVAAAVSADLPRPARAFWIGLALVCLPLCGGAGILQAPAWMAWTGWIGWRGIRSDEPDRRVGGRILLAALVACFAMCLAGALIVRSRVTPSPVAPWGDVGLHTAALLALAFGPAAIRTWPASGWFILCFGALTIWMLVHGVRREPREAIRRLALLAAVLAVVSLAVGSSLVRAQLGWQNGFALRYVTLTTPLVCAAYVAWTAYGSKIARAWIPALVAGLALAALPLNVVMGRQFGATQRQEADELERLIRSGATAAGIVDFYSDRFHCHPLGTRPILQALAAQRRPPFDLEPSFSATLFDYIALDRVPASIESEVPNSLRFVDDHWALLARSGTRIHLAIRAGEAHLSARIEVPPELVGRRFSTAVRARIEMADAGGRLRTLVERVLDSGPEVVELDLPPHGDCELVLGTESPVEEKADRSWMYWIDVAIR